LINLTLLTKKFSVCDLVNNILYLGMVSDTFELTTK